MEFTLDPAFTREWAVSDECLDVLTDAADNIHDAFNDIAPRRTGNMVNSTASHPAQVAGAWQVELVVNIYYAKFVEAGTRYMQAQHNLRHAMQIVESETRA